MAGPPECPRRLSRPLRVALRRRAPRPPPCLPPGSAVRAPHARRPSSPFVSGPRRGVPRLAAPSGRPARHSRRPSSGPVSLRTFDTHAVFSRLFGHLRSSFTHTLPFLTPRFRGPRRNPRLMQPITRISPRHAAVFPYATTPPDTHPTPDTVPAVLRTLTRSRLRLALTPTHALTRPRPSTPVHARPKSLSRPRPRPPAPGLPDPPHAAVPGRRRGSLNAGPAPGRSRPHRRYATHP